MPIVKRALSSFVLLSTIFTTTICCSKPDMDNQNDNKKNYEISVQVDDDSLEDLLPNFQDIELTVTANDEWDYSIINSTDESEWIRCVFIGKKEGNKKIFLSIKENVKDKDRSATVRFLCGDKYADVKIKQKSSNTIMTTAGWGYSLQRSGGDCEFEVLSLIPYEYEINDEWIVEKEKESWANNTVKFTVLENNTIVEREGTITFRNEISETIVHFKQKEGVPQLSIAQGRFDIDSNGGEVSIDVFTNLSLTVTIDEGCTWVHELSTKSLSPTVFNFVVDKNETGKERKVDIFFDAKEHGIGLRAAIHQSK